MFGSEGFNHWFKQVIPIIQRFKKVYYIHLWDGGDWLQEGRIILYQILNQNTSDDKIIPYFSVKFKCHVLDTLRFQEAQKRQMNQPEFLILDDSKCYFDIPEDAQIIENIIVKDELISFYDSLSEKDVQRFQKILSDQILNKDAHFRKLKQQLKQLFEQQIY
jgi:competence protein ComX